MLREKLKYCQVSLVPVSILGIENHTKSTLFVAFCITDILCQTYNERQNLLLAMDCSLIICKQIYSFVIPQTG